MRFLAIVRRKTESFSDEEINAVLDAEAERVRELYTTGIFRGVWSRADVKGAVVELECHDLGEVESHLESLPLAQQGMIEIKVIPLLPYRGFAPLHPSGR